MGGDLVEKPSDDVEPAHADVETDDSPSSDASIDAAIRALFEGYREIVLCTERLPRFGRWTTTATGGKPRKSKLKAALPRPRGDEPATTGSDPREADVRAVGRPGGRRVSRVYTRLYVESHIRRRSIQVARALRLHSLGAAPERAKELLEAADRLSAQTSALAGWARVRSAVARLPLVSAATPVVTSAVVAFAFGTSDAAQRHSVIVAAMAVGAVALLALLLVWLPSVRWGFRVKRALFAGGRLPDESREEDEDGTPVDQLSEVQWMDFPTVNTYLAENGLFHALRVPKRREVPIDLILEIAAGAYALLIPLTMISSLLVDWKRNILWGALGGVGLLAQFYPTSDSGILRIRRAPAFWRRRNGESMC